MKKMCTLYLFLVLFMNGIQAQWSPPGWEPQAQGLVPEHHIVYDISVVDTNIVWVLTLNTVVTDTMNQFILRTINGGADWDAYYMEDYVGLQINSLTGINDSVAWISVVDWENTTAQFFKTANAGESWKLKHTISDGIPFPVLKFVDDSTGYFIDLNVLEAGYTLDGGESWDVVNLPTSDAFYSVQCPQAWFDVQGDTIWVADSKSVFRSTDGGTTWDKENIPGNYNKGTVAFDKNGYGITGGDIDYDLYPDPSAYLDHTVFHTSDDFGETWNFQAIPNAPFPLSQIIAVPGEEKAFIGISGIWGWVDPSIDRSWASAFTLDGGQSWTAIDQNIPYTGIGFASLETGWIGAVGNYDYGYAEKPLLFKLKGVISSTKEVASSVEAVSVWPNPASDLLHVDLPESVNGTVDISIYGVEGELFRQYSLTPGEGLDVTGLAPGIYVLKAVGKDKVFGSRFVKQ